MFTQPCFIRKDTTELRKKLKDLGQRENSFDDFSGKWLAANHGMFISVSEGFQNLCKEDIDCGTNEQLFLAIAALNDNGDYMQWFTNGKRWYQNKINDIEIIRLGAGSPIGFHKAIVEELIEHFKNKY